MRPTTDVSSANLMMWLELNLAVQSWVSSVKSSGLSTQPCGAPVLSVVAIYLGRPSGTPPGVPGGLTTTPMELVDESAIQNVASRNPASLLRTITLPVYQVLVTSTPTPHINKSSYRIGRRPLDESGRRGGRGLGLKGRANDGFDLRYMKNRVNVFKRGG